MAAAAHRAGPSYRDHGGLWKLFAGQVAVGGELYAVARWRLATVAGVFEPGADFTVAQAAVLAFALRSRRARATTCATTNLPRRFTVSWGYASLRTV